MPPAIDREDRAAAAKASAARSRREKAKARRERRKRLELARETAATKAAARPSGKVEEDGSFRTPTGKTVDAETGKVRDPIFVPTRKARGHDTRKHRTRVPGNIRLSERPIVHNKDGSVSTVRSIGIRDRGREVNIPTVVNGRVVSDKQAIAHYRRTGEHLGKFDSVQAAEKDARQTHQLEAKRVASRRLARETRATKAAARPSGKVEEDGSFGTPTGRVYDPDTKKVRDIIRPPGEKKRRRKATAEFKAETKATRAAARPREKTAREQFKEALAKEGKRGGYGLPNLGAVSGDVKEIGYGIADTAADYGTAIPSDVGNLLRGRRASRTTNLLKRDALGLAETVNTMIPDAPSWVPEAIAKERFADEDVIAAEKGTAGKFWRENPLIGALMVAPVGNAIARRASHGAIEANIRRANPEMTAKAARKVAKRESKYPGYAEAHDIEGGIKPRELKGEFGEAVGRPTSRTPIGRAGQRAYDRGSKFIEATRGPGARFSTSHRAATAFRRGQDKARSRTDVEIHRLERVVRKAVKKRGKDPSEQAALVAALEGPKGVTPRQAVEMRIADLRETPTAAIGQDRVRIQAALDRRVRDLEKALVGSRIDSPAFAKAVDALESISTQAEQAFRKTFPTVTDEQLAARRNLIVSRYAKGGRLPEGVAAEARGFFPHRDELEHVSGQMGAPTLTASGNVVGRPQPGRAFERRENKLALYEQGRVQTNPRVLSNTARQRERFGQTQEARRYLYDNAKDIAAGEPMPRNPMFIRNPDTDAQHIPANIRAAVENPDEFANLVSRTGEAPDSGTVGKFVDTWLWKGHGPKPEWMDDLSNVRVVPEGIAKAVLTDVFSSAPRGSFASIVGTLNAVARANTIYLPYLGGRYVVRNTAQNIVLGALTHPKMFLRTKATLGVLRKEHNDVYEAIKAETGTVAAGAGLPELPGRRQSGAQRVEGAATDASRGLANRLGNLSDEPWRVASWVQYAREYGFKTPDEMRHLLTSDAPKIARVRDAIAQYVRDDMLDFNALPPGAAQTLTRAFFIVPFRYAAAKWPAMFLREYPTRAAILSLIAAQHDRPETPGRVTSVLESGRTEIGGREVDLGWLAPHMPAAETVEDAVDFGQGLGKNDVNVRPLLEQFTPQLRSFVDAGGYGGEPREQIAGWAVPGFSTGKKIAKGGGLGEQALRMTGSTIDFVEKRRKKQAAITEERKVVLPALAGKWDAEDMRYVRHAYDVYEGIEQIRAKAQEETEPGEAYYRRIVLDEAEYMKSLGVFDAEDVKWAKRIAKTGTYDEVKKLRDRWVQTTYESLYAKPTRNAAKAAGYERPS